MGRHQVGACRQQRAAGSHSRTRAFARGAVCSGPRARVPSGLVPLAQAPRPARRRAHRIAEWLGDGDNQSELRAPRHPAASAAAGRGTSRRTRRDTARWAPGARDQQRELAGERRPPGRGAAGAPWYAVRTGGLGCERVGPDGRRHGGNRGWRMAHRQRDAQDWRSATHQQSRASREIGERIRRPCPCVSTGSGEGARETPSNTRFAQQKKHCAHAGWGARRHRPPSGAGGQIPPLDQRRWLPA